MDDLGVAQPYVRKPAYVRWNNGTYAQFQQHYIRGWVRVKSYALTMVPFSSNHPTIGVANLIHTYPYDEGSSNRNDPRDEWILGNLNRSQ